MPPAVPIRAATVYGIPSAENEVSASVQHLAPSVSGTTVVGRSPSTSREDSASLGLHVLHEPDKIGVDIIFVHGLGGHSQRTWSKNHDPSLFWPELWLPFEPGVGLARILTFGYNANWRGPTRSFSNVTDFAKELLFEMRFAKNDGGEDLGLGSRPIIFVVHSMGGLVVKKAYLLGLHDETYSRVINAVSAIIFLSTPHRGSNLAETLNRVLSASFQSPKSFISDLNKSSPAIEELNEQFRHHAPKLSIWSFYETLATPIGPKKLMVLDKDSSMLGYPAEISRPLQADHHDVCKYSSPIDSNYVTVRNAIKSLVSMFRPKPSQQAGDADGTESDRAILRQLSKVCSAFDGDFDAIRRNWVPHTCTWILREPELVSWMHSSTESVAEPKILWYSAPPANGKSTIAAFLIDHLKANGHCCQYFFFKCSDHEKRSVANSFRAMTLQLAMEVSGYRSQLGMSSFESWGLDSTDPFVIWRSMFEKCLSNAAVTHPIYWVVDALDECESPQSFLDCLRSLRDTNTTLRVLVLSRNTEPISTAFDKVSRVVPVSRLEMTGRSHNKGDLRLFLQQEMFHMKGSPFFKNQLMERVLTRAEGNFLWTKLVLGEISRCHTEESIEEVLEEVPDDMMDLYQRMEKSLIGSARKSNKPLIRELFQWAICAQRSLTLAEMSHALRPRFPHFMDLRWTIKDTCGQFLQAEDDDNIEILHHTAREYLTRSKSSEFHVETKKTHGELFCRTLEVLKDTDLRWRLTQSQRALQATEPFVFYAAINWSYHLGHSHQSDDAFLDLLVGFFRSPAVLTWIHALAVLRKLEVLVKTSQVLSSFVQSTRKHNASKNPLQHRLNDLEFFDDWTVDLIKIVGKFGSHLVTRPRAIYDVVPALCPGQSIMYRSFHDNKASALKTTLATAHTSWNDNLARLPIPGNSQGYKISCAGKHIAALILGKPGTTHVWDSTNFNHIYSIEHGEACLAMAMNQRGDELATYGLKTTKIWSIPSARLLDSTKNPRYIKAQAIAFSEGNRELLLGADDNVIRRILRDEFEQGWKIPHPNLLNDTARLEGTIINSPMCVAFNGDKTQVGVSYRAAPLSVWNLLDGRCINRCNRSKEFQNNRRQSSMNKSSTTWFAVDRFTWNPVTNHILGIYRDGCVFKWHPLTDENIEAPHARADEIASSPDGRLFSTSSATGVVRIWNFAYFTVIYQLSSDDLVTELAFSPDSRRFYDLRGSSVNAWESNSLARFFEKEEHGSSDTNSESRSTTELSKFSEETLVPFEAVTAFAPAPDGMSYAVGHKDGSVRLCQKGEADGMVLARFQRFFDVQHIKWSHDGTHIVLGDLAGNIEVRSVRRDPSQPDAFQISRLPSPNIRLNNLNIRDVIFSIDSGKLLILTQAKAFLCSLATGTLDTLKEIDNCGGLQWLPHPTQPEIILVFGRCDVRTYRWRDLELQQTSSYQRIHKRSALGASTVSPTTFCDSSVTGGLSPLPLLSLESSENISAMLTQDGKHFLVSGRPSPGVAGSTTHQTWLLVEVDSLKSDSNNCFKAVVDYKEVPGHISSQVKTALGVSPGSKFIFLDQDLWVCSYALDSMGYDDIGATACQRLYFIPRDWVGSVSLERCVLMKDGTLFWPRNDGVVAIESNLDDSWSLFLD